MLKCYLQRKHFPEAGDHLGLGTGLAVKRQGFVPGSSPGHWQGEPRQITSPLWASVSPPGEWSELRCPLQNAPVLTHGKHLFKKYTIF